MRCSICLNDKDTVFWAIRGDACQYCLHKIRRRRLDEPLEPMPEFAGPEKVWESVSRTIIGIFDGRLLGLRCAKIQHGANVIEEVIQGYRYENGYGMLIQRATCEEVSEDKQCMECRLTLWACNAMEVVV